MHTDNSSYVVLQYLVLCSVFPASLVQLDILKIGIVQVSCFC